MILYMHQDMQIYYLDFYGLILFQGSQSGVQISPGMPFKVI